MSHLEVLDLIILILEGLLCIATICESGYKIYKEYKSYMEDRKKRMTNKMMRDWDGPDDEDMDMGWGANSSWTSSAYYPENQVAVLDEKELDEHELAWEFELDKMEREAR
ncbi:hypothetical protein H9Q74_009601 [Fusarium xylarioides]|nr:hypothetical protein H9Q71_012223 [Fusarium xylarioides]KAG5819212.1 hypothetical protein H9Q74_009601 [Fusarium xylarioides]